MTVRARPGGLAVTGWGFSLSVVGRLLNRRFLFWKESLLAPQTAGKVPAGTRRRTESDAVAGVIARCSELLGGGVFWLWMPQDLLLIGRGC